MSQFIDRTGCQTINAQGEVVTITKYRKHDDFDIRFLDTGHTKTYHGGFATFMKHGPRDPYWPTVCGIGYIGNTTTKTDRECKEAYSRWYGMLERCYGKRRAKKYPSYYECEVCSEWLCFENFEQWYEVHSWKCGNERMDLNKDLLVPQNKIYGPNTCLIVPTAINSFIAGKRHDKCGLPTGIVREGQLYKVQVSAEVSILEESQKRYIGLFANLDDAKQAYIDTKKELGKKIACAYKVTYPNFPLDLYNLLLQWEPTI